MAQFNLPFGVRISTGDPIDKDRYIAVDQSARESLITSERAHVGLQVYQEDTSTLYILKTLGSTPSTSTWDEIGTGESSTLWSVTGNDASNTNSGDINIINNLNVSGNITTDNDGSSIDWNTAYNNSINTNPTFSTSTGVLTFTQQDTSTLTVDLDGRYLTSYTETDPTVATHIKSITTTNINNWNTSYNNSINTNPTFSTSTGVITFTQQDTTTLTVDLDGRYLTSNQTITLTGDVTGSGTNSITCTVADDSHNHIISNIDGLQTALDGKITAVTAGNGLTDGGSSGSVTLNVASHSGTAGSIGTVNISADAVGVNLGTTSTTAFRGDYGNTAYSHVSSTGTQHSYINQSVTTAASPTFNALTVTNNVTANNFVLSSDIRLKENIFNIEKSNIDDISIKSFNFIKDEEKRLRYGVIAQELEKVHPELVSENIDGYKQVSYIDYLLLKINEKDNQIKNLQEDIKYIKEKIN